MKNAFWNACETFSLNETLILQHLPEASTEVQWVWGKQVVPDCCTRHKPELISLPFTLSNTSFKNQSFRVWQNRGNLWRFPCYHCLWIIPCFEDVKHCFWCGFVCLFLNQKLGLLKTDRRKTLFPCNISATGERLTNAVQHNSNRNTSSKMREWERNGFVAFNLHTYYSEPTGIVITIPAIHLKTNLNWRWEC